MESKFTRMPKNSAVDHVINQIKDQLMSGSMKPGDKLPSETELCKSLGVSRGSLRSAMNVFKALGVIDIRIGDGTYVCSTISANNLNPLIFSLLILNPRFNTLTQFREKIELDILDLIINSPELTAKIIPELKINLEQQRQLHLRTATPEEFAMNDKEFHSIIAANCGNIVFQTVYSYIFDFFFPYILESHKKQNHGVVASDVHMKIFNAINSSNFSLAKSSISESVVSWSSLLK